jgi:hypothetical protein
MLNSEKKTGFFHDPKLIKNENNLRQLKATMERATEMQKSPDYHKQQEEWRNPDKDIEPLLMTEKFLLL